MNKRKVFVRCLIGFHEVKKANSVAGCPLWEFKEISRYFFNILIDRKKKDLIGVLTQQRQDHIAMIWIK